MKYIGHGERKSISFESKYGEVHAVDVHTLKMLLKVSQASSRTKIVVVSACYSEEAGFTFIEAGICTCISICIHTIIKVDTCI
jgi:hypothetical protein